MIRFDVLTLFPEYFDVMNLSIVGRGIQNGHIVLETHDIRENSIDKHKKTDDYPYGGGEGMIMTVQPIYDTYRKVKSQIRPEEKSIFIYMSPKGKVLNQEIVKDLAGYDRIMILCGHYEGIDQRVIDEIVDMEISIGDFVLTGGRASGNGFDRCRKPIGTRCVGGGGRIRKRVPLRRSAGVSPVYKTL